MAFYEQKYKVGVVVRVLAVIGAIISLVSSVALFISAGKNSWFLLAGGLSLSFLLSRVGYRGYTTESRDDGNE